MLSLGVLLIIGIGVVGGVAGGALFKKMKIPQVLGYLFSGILIGNSGLKIVTIADVESLKTFNMFALGVIGFLVGSEIHFSTFKKYGKQLSLILISEGLLAFFLTALGTGTILYIITGSLAIATAGGIVLGAIASATDPASTINVLKEYKTAGIFTTTLIAVIALDDALAMGLYGLATGFSQVISGSSGISVIIKEISHVIYELGGSLLLGIVTGSILTLIFRKSNNYDNSVSASSGILLLVVGIGIYLNFDIILISMAAAITFVNINPTRSKKYIDYIKSISNPIYVFFFVLIGARISFNSMPLWVWSIIGAYVVARTIGKFYGAKLGARFSNSEKVVEKYVGLGLFSQGGVAIGLSIMAATHLDNIIIIDDMSLGDLIITVVAMTTFIVQLIGPAAVKIASKKSNEAGKSVSVEDIIQESQLENYIIHETLPTASLETTAKEIVDIFSKSNFETVPITNEDGLLAGVVELEDIRSTLSEPNVWQWIIADDIMNDNYNYLETHIPLSRAFQLCEQYQVNQMVVCDSNKLYRGYFDKHSAMKKIKSEIIKNMNV